MFLTKTFFLGNPQSSLAAGNERYRFFISAGGAHLQTCSSSWHWSYKVSSHVVVFGGKTMNTHLKSRLENVQQFTQSWS